MRLCNRLRLRLRLRFFFRFRLDNFRRFLLRLKLRLRFGFRRRGFKRRGRRGRGFLQRRGTFDNYRLRRLRRLFRRGRGLGDSGRFRLRLQFTNRRRSRKVGNGRLRRQLQTAVGFRRAHHHGKTRVVLFGQFQMPFAVVLVARVGGEVSVHMRQVQKHIGVVAHSAGAQTVQPRRRGTPVLVFFGKQGARRQV